MCLLCEVGAGREPWGLCCFLGVVPRGEKDREPLFWRLLGEFNPHKAACVQDVPTVGWNGPLPSHSPPASTLKQALRPPALSSPPSPSSKP
jgi:hypothetical protein